MCRDRSVACLDVRRLALAVALFSIVAACSDDTTDTTPASTPTVTTSPPAGTTTPEPTTTSSTSGITTTAPAPTTTAESTTTAAPTTTSVGPVPLADLDLDLEVVATGFRQPVFLDAPPGDDRLFVVDQPGVVFVVDQGEVAVFLDIADRVRFGGERGLLGLTFHPDDTSRLFLHYTGLDGDTVVSEFDAAGEEREVLRVPQPAGNHNGGMIAFGPEGYLYIGLGDGGGSNDRFGHGQDPDTLLGTILRIDVDGATPYAIPAENPFVDGGGAPEIWAWGLRNPWRFAFDGDLLFIGDVGQNQWEEIDVIGRRSRGPNFGWPVHEGTACFEGPNCGDAGFVPPVVEYEHGEGRCSVTGGYVYRGTAIPELDGAYFYGDFCSGDVWSFRIDGEGVFAERRWTDTLGAVPGLTSFGTDGFGELYLTVADGTVYQLVRG